MTVQMDFEQSAQTVYETLTNPEYLIARNLDLGELSAECTFEEGEGGATIHAIREVRRELPGLLAKLFDPVNVMDMEEKWQAEGDGWRGHWEMDVRGQPVSISGDFELVPLDEGCRYSVSHQARVNIPFMSGQVAKFILGQTSRGASDELNYLRDHLAPNGA